MSRAADPVADRRGARLVIEALYADPAKAPWSSGSSSVES
jgi:hypothetical protein